MDRFRPLVRTAPTNGTIVVPIPPQPDDLLDDSPWPSMEFVLLGPDVIRLDEPIRFSVSWKDMPIGAAIQIGLQSLPLPQRMHDRRRRDGLSARIGSVIRMTQASGSYDVQWTIQDRLNTRLFHLAARFVEGVWQDAPGKSCRAAMPRRRAFEDFIGPLVRIDEPSPATDKPQRASPQPPADLASLATTLSSLKVTDAINVVQALQKRWEVGPPPTNRQPWPAIGYISGPSFCGVGYVPQGPVYPRLLRPSDNNMDYNPGWDVALLPPAQADRFRISEVVKRLWACGSTEALQAIRNAPLVIAGNVKFPVADDIIAMFDGLGADIIVLRPL